MKSTPDNELPVAIKGLYRHWYRHVNDSSLIISDISSVIGDEQLCRELDWFIHERMAMWRNKQQGQAPPYTENPILQTYRFCNILRELDRQTIEYHTMLAPLRDDFALWLLNMFYARMVARPETVRMTGLLSYDDAVNEQVYQRLCALPSPKYGTPYVFPVSVIMKSDTPTREAFIARHLSRVMTSVAEEITSWTSESVLGGIKKVMPLFVYNMAFLWTEVLIDVAYQYPETVDLFAPFPIGPGSAPTFARMGEAKEATQRVHQLGSLRVPSGVTIDGKQITLSCENWEGIGCEFRKFTNLSRGKGRKRYYR